MSEKPNNTSSSRQRLPEARLNSHEEIDTWYRNLRPDRDINEVPLEVHMDAVASSVLLSFLPNLPKDRTERLAMLDSLMLAAPDKVLNGVASKLIAGGPNVYPLLDLTTELAERTDQPENPELVAKLLGIGIHVAREIRDTNDLDREEKLNANKKWASLRETELRHRAKHNPDKVEDFDKEFVAIVMAEASYVYHWPAGESVKRTGALFETMIGCLAKYRAWQYGAAREVAVRHATDREDKPDMGFRGKTKCFVAHDVVLRSAVNEALIQCKWHAEDKGREYEPNIIMVEEESRDGKMARNEEFKQAFADIAQSVIRPTMSGGAVERLIERYPEIDEALDRATRPREARMGGVVVGAS